MNILLINKSYQIGGAAIAAQRLWKAILKVRSHARFLVYDEILTNEDHLIAITHTKWDKLKWWFHFIFERLYFLPHEKDKSVRFAFSPAVTGKNISRLKSVKEADIIHLHWFNQGFLSIQNLGQLATLNKPIVWTLHDMWAFTGGCHLIFDCENYKQECKNCFYLKNPSETDLSSKVFKKKEAFYRDANITFVACSNWMKSLAENSTLLKKFKIIQIPNPINIARFCPGSKHKSRTELALPINKTLILFGAANVTNKNKGFEFLVEGINTLVNNNASFKNNTEIIIIGKIKTDLSDLFSLKVNYMGNISDEARMASIYQSADLFVLPTLMDNLPNMIIESMACLTPTVSFNIGGVPEIIDHKQNGYLAEYRSSEDLANGIKWVLDNNMDNKLGKAAREKVIRCFSEEVVAQQYIDLYKSLLNKSVS